MKRTLIDELLILWSEANSRADLPDGLKIEMDEQCHEYFDERTLRYIAEVARTVRFGDDVAIAALNRPTKTLTDLCKLIGGRNAEYLLLIDSIDDFWDGSGPSTNISDGGYSRVPRSLDSGPVGSGVASSSRKYL